MSNNHPSKGASHRLRKALVVRAINSMAPPKFLARQYKHIKYELSKYELIKYEWYYKRISKNGRNEEFRGARC